MPPSQQPFLHDLVAVLAAPTQAWSSATADLDLVDGVAPRGCFTPTYGSSTGSCCGWTVTPGSTSPRPRRGPEATFTTLLRHVGAELARTRDPQVRLDRVRRVQPGTVTDEMIVSSRLDTEVTVQVEINFGGDGVSIETIKMGRATAARSFPAPSGDRVRWSVSGLTAELSCPEATLERAEDDTTVRARWSIRVPAHGQATLGWRLELQDPTGWWWPDGDRWPDGLRPLHLTTGSAPGCEARSPTWTPC